MTNLVCERGFEIVSAGRAVGGKLQLRSVFSAWPRIDADVCFGDVACFRIEEDARASGGRVGVEGFVFRSTAIVIRLTPSPASAGLIEVAADQVTTKLIFDSWPNARAHDARRRLRRCRFDVGARREQRS
jgi:hypothetical protein